MNWNNFDHNFCEGYLHGLPEYYNAFSSLFISLFGLIGLYNLNNLSNILIFRIVYSLLFINGFSSFMYHWTGTIGWALYDEFPMIITLFLGMVAVDDIDNYSLNKQYLNFKIILYLNMMILYLIIDTMTSQRLIFPLYFGSGLLYIINIILRLVNNFNIINSKILILKKTYLYIFIIISSAIIWTLTEFSCRKLDINNLKPLYHLYLFGHPMWHFMISYGFYNLIQIVLYIKLYLTKFDVELKEKYKLLYIKY
jgi:hypothetical protein